MDVMFGDGALFEIDRSALATSKSERFFRPPDFIFGCADSAMNSGCPCSQLLPRFIFGHHIILSILSVAGMAFGF